MVQRLIVLFVLSAVGAALGMLAPAVTRAQQAETIASCGALAGFSYFPTQTFVPADEAG